VEQDEITIVKGREVTYKVKFYRCRTCGTEFEMPGMLDNNLKSARESALVIDNENSFLECLFDD